MISVKIMRMCKSVYQALLLHLDGLGMRLKLTLVIIDQKLIISEVFMCVNLRWLIIHLFYKLVTLGCFVGDDEYKRAVVRENLNTIRRKFAKLVVTVSRLLQRKNVDVNSVRLFLCSRLELDSSPDCIPKSQVLGEIFEAISRNGLWDYNNYTPIEDVIDIYGEEDGELLGHLEAYEKDLAGFLLTTKIVDYMRYSADADKQPTVENPVVHNPDYYHSLSVKLRVNVTDESLSYLKNLWKKIAKFFLLPSLSVLLDSIVGGSLTVTWRVPSSFIRKIKAQLYRSSSLFRRLGITVIYDEEKILYSEELASMLVYV